MIDMPRIKEWAKNVDIARHSLFVLDACFSGLALQQAKKADVGAMTLTKLAQPAHHIMTAGIEHEESYTYNGKSIFTQAFLDAAEGRFNDAQMVSCH